jgi:hypothetical protein
LTLPRLYEEWTSPEPLTVDLHEQLREAAVPSGFWRWRRSFCRQAGRLLLAALGLIVVVAVELALFGDQAAQNLDVLHQKETTTKAASARQPDPLPVVEPPAGGLISQAELRPLDGCRAGGMCTVLVQLGLRSPHEPLEAAWRFEIVDRCTGNQAERGLGPAVVWLRGMPPARRGGRAPSPPDRDRRAVTPQWERPPGTALAVARVTTEPAPARGGPMRPAGDKGAC